MHRATFAVSTLLLLNLFWYIHTIAHKSGVQAGSGLTERHMRKPRSAATVNTYSGKEAGDVNRSWLHTKPGATFSSTQFHTATVTTRPTETTQVSENYADMFESLIAIPMMTTYMKNQTNIMIQRSRLVNEQLARYKIKARFISGMTSLDSRAVLPFIMREVLQACIESKDSRYCLFFQDDTVLHPKLITELPLSLATLPSNWMVFHMCPGAIQGKFTVSTSAMGNKSSTKVPLEKILLEETDATRYNFSLSEERYTKHIQTPEPGANSYGRYFAAHRPRVDGAEIQMGCPVAFVIRQIHAEALYKHVIHFPRGHDDAVLARNAILPVTYVAREPQLCFHLRGPSVLTPGQEGT
eukprot:m.95756 g.95756  ORF g.95756 m.95756 type:complete len:354 (-) comp16615_c0_seq4:83-1144(-)